jgi:hypothetical protein
MPPPELLEIEGWLIAVALTAGHEAQLAFTQAERAYDARKRARTPIEAAEAGSEAFAAIAKLHRYADLAEDAAREALKCRDRREARTAALRARQEAA